VVGLGVPPTVSFCLAFGFAFSVTYWLVQNVTTNERINQARYSYFHQYAPSHPRALTHPVIYFPPRCPRRRDDSCVHQNNGGVAAGGWWRW
jgi:hypothetical protein